MWIDQNTFSTSFNGYSLYVLHNALKKAAMFLYRDLMCSITSYAFRSRLPPLMQKKVDSWSASPSPRAPHARRCLKVAACPLRRQRGAADGATSHLSSQ